MGFSGVFVFLNISNSDFSCSFYIIFGFGAFGALFLDSPCFSASVAPFLISKGALGVKIGTGRYFRKHRYLLVSARPSLV